MPDPLDSLTAEQKRTLSGQAKRLYHAARPVISKASQSTVVLSYKNQRISYGTVVRDPKSKQNIILTKWSEIAYYHKRLKVIAPNEKYHWTELIGIYPEYDLAVLKTDLKLTPLSLNHAATPDIGEFLAAADASNGLLALGVVSVKERSLRETDKAFLGVLMSEKSSSLGTRLDRVEPQSPASRAGLRQGDIITSIDKERFKGATEIRNTLQRLEPGTRIQVDYLRGKQKASTKVVLGSRPSELDPSRFPRQRLNEMQQMGAAPNRIRHGFPSVIQSDMKIQYNETPGDPRDDYTNECGGPVVNLDGQTVGIIIARGSRIKTFIIPAHTISELLKTKASQPTRNYTARQTPNQARGSGRSGYPRRYSPRPPRAIPLEE